MFTCRGCEVVMKGRRSRIYCTNACQMAVAQQEHIRQWLDSGVAFVDSGRRHGVRTHLMEEQSGCCAICGSAATWNAEPLTLVLDHIDADFEQQPTRELSSRVPELRLAAAYLQE
jgi:hypothetical protein